MAVKTKKRTSTKGVRTEPARQGLDLEKAAAKHREVEERAEGDLLNLKDGWNYLFLLPPWSKEGVIWKEVEQHGRGVCPKRAVDKDCLVCTEMVKRAKRGDSDFVEQNRLKSRAFFNAVKRENVRKLLTVPEAVIKVLPASGVTFREILEYINDEKVDISDPSAAVLVGIKKTGKGLRTRYKVKMGDPVDISKYITPKVMRCLHDLDAFRFAQPMSIKEQRKIIRGAADEDEDFGDEEDIEDEDLDEGEEGNEEEETEEDEVFEEQSDEEEEDASEAEDDEEGDEDEEIEDEGEDGDEDELDDDGEDEGEEEEEEEPPPKRKKAKPAPASSKPKPKLAGLAGKVSGSVKKKVKR